MDSLYYYPATTTSYNDDSRHDHSVWSPTYASTTASSSRSSDSSYPSDDESGSTQYYTPESSPKVDYNEGSELSLFARTLKEQDDLFYSTFPDARPANYRFLSAFPPGSFLTASPPETVAPNDIPVTPPENSHYDYHTPATRPLLSTSHARNDPVAYSTLSRATRNPNHDSLRTTAATPVLETSNASPLVTPPALVPSQRQADTPMEIDTSTSLHARAERPDSPRKEPASTDHPLLQVSTQDANLITSSPSHTVSLPDTPQTPSRSFPTESGRDDTKDLRLAVAGQYPWPYPQRQPAPSSLLASDTKLEAARAYPSPPESHVEDNSIVTSAVSTTKQTLSAPSSPTSVPANDVGPPKLVPTRSPRRLGNRKPVLACLFCRGRKIACGPPVPGGPDNACNQCQRRSLKCEFPCENRRGARKAAKIAKSRSESENS